MWSVQQSKAHGLRLLAEARASTYTPQWSRSLSPLTRIDLIFGIVEEIQHHEYDEEKESCAYHRSPGKQQSGERMCREEGGKEETIVRISGGMRGR